MESFALQDVLSVPGLKEQLPVSQQVWYSLGWPCPCCEQTLHCPLQAKGTFAQAGMSWMMQGNSRNALQKAVALYLSGMAQSHLGGPS